MRRTLFFGMLISGILTIIVGIAEGQSWHTGPAVAHIVIASVFIICCVWHLVVNRKPFMKYIRGK